MDQWDNYFPPLNLLNYNLHWQWVCNSVTENLSDGGDLDSIGLDSGDGNTVGDDR